MADLQAGGSALTSGDQADIRAGLGLGNSATRNVGTTAGTVAAGDDSRLSNARAPTAHGHDADDITDSTTVGRAVLTAADAAAARAAIGAASASGAGIFGPYADTTALQAAKPAASNPGSMAYVGASAPYAQYVSTGSAWVLVGGSGGAYEVADWAALLALTGVPDGRVYTVLAPVISGGMRGSVWVRDSANVTGWRPGGQQTLWMSSTTYSGLAGGNTTEEILAQIQIPAGLLLACAHVQVRNRFVWSASDSNTRSVRLRLGAAGTTSDAVLYPFTGLGATIRMLLFPISFAPISATSIRTWMQSTGAGSISPDALFSTTSAASDTAVASMSGALWLSFTAQAGASPTATASLNLASLTVE